MVSVFSLGLAFPNHICRLPLKHLSFLECIINRSIFNQELKGSFPSDTNCPINMKWDLFCNDFSCRTSPSFTCWQVSSRPDFLFAPLRIETIWIAGRCHHTQTAAVSRRRWFDPLRAQPNLQEWTWSAARPRSSRSSVSSFSHFLLGLGRFKRLMYRCVCLINHGGSCKRRSKGGRKELEIRHFPSLASRYH